MSVSALSHKLTPPKSPTEALGDWGAVEDALKTALPDDYKAFIRCYGSGVIGNFITVFNPFAVRPTLNLLPRAERQLEILRELRTSGEPRPFDLHPAKPGLLPVAMTDNGDVIHWLTAGKTADWTIVVNEARSPSYQSFRYDLTGFIEAVVDDAAHVSAFPTLHFDGPLAFRSL
ncbi:MAG TPA: SMI1/KNR4 family protein [Rhizomicrobium sp.]|jgi:hypothetical protein|nr:SMI1/KNR4 family protein [Rhizomicrobium sp.]